MKKISILLSFNLFLVIHTYAQQDDPKATEVWEPEPKVITPGVTPQDAPSDAIILFNGKDN